MDVEFVVPLSPDDLDQSSNAQSFVIANHIDIDTLSDDTVTSLLNDVDERITETPSDIAENEYFDPVFDLCRHAAKLTAVNQSRIAALLITNTHAIIQMIRADDADNNGDAVRSYRSPLKMSLYLTTLLMTSLQRHMYQQAQTSSLAEVEPKAKVRGGKRNKKTKNDDDDDDDSASAIDWPSELTRLIASLSDTIADASFRLTYNNGAVDEPLSNCIFHCVHLMYEHNGVVGRTSSASALRSSIALLWSQVVATFKLESAAATATLHSLMQNEALATPLAEVVHQCATQHATPLLITEALTEFGHIDSQSLARDAAGARSVSTFLCHLATLSPKSILANIAIIEGQLDNESYVIRNGIIQLIGIVIEKAFGVDTVNDTDRSTSKSDQTSVNRTKLFDLLFIRCHDVHAFARSKTLQTLCALVRSRQLHADQFYQLPSAAAERMADNSSHVRKYAVQLLTLCMQYNPHTGVMRGEPWQTECEQLQNKCQTFKSNRRQSQVAAAAKLLAETADDNEEEETEKGDEEISFNSSKDVATSETYRADLVRLEVCQRVLSLITTLSESATVGIHLLHSSTSSDALEAIDFFVAAQQFQLPAAMDGVRAMLSLVWSREQSVRDAVLTAYRTLYIGSDIDELTGAAARKHALIVAAKLIPLTLSATINQLTSLEECLSRLNMNTMILDALFEMFTASAGVSDEERVGALMLYSMASKLKSTVTADTLNGIITIGIGQKALTQPNLCRVACQSLQQFKSAVDKLDSAIVDSLIARLEFVLLDRTVHPDAANWYGAAEQVITSIFRIHSHPDMIMARVIKQMTDLAFSETETSDVIGNAEMLARLLFVVGCVCVQVLVMLETLEAECKKNKSIAKSKTSATDSSKPNSAAAERSAIETELAVGASEEYELEQVRERCERSLVALNGGDNEQSLLAHFIPIILHVITKPKMYAHRRLQSAAALTLSKLMCVSADFCQAHIGLLFALLKHSPSHQIRANAVVALGDLAYRHPNIVEPWSNHIFTSLNDSHSTVQLNTLMVLIHLILNDMLKIKGPIALLAKCIISTDIRMNELARYFFHELSAKGKSPIYNLLPDIISRLSIDESLNIENVQIIFKFLLNFIDKDKQIESLVEKLCQRFTFIHTNEEDGAEEKEQIIGQIEQAIATESPITTDETSATTAGDTASNASAERLRVLKQCRDISYCLSQLNFTAAAIKRLLSLHKLYQAKVGDNIVYEHFTAIINKARKFAKTELKAVVDELEEKVNTFHNKAIEDRRMLAGRRRNKGEADMDDIGAESTDGGAAAAVGDEVLMEVETDSGSVVDKENDDENVKPSVRASRTVRGGRGRGNTAAATRRGRGRGAVQPVAKPTRRRKAVELSDESLSEESEEESDDDDEEEEEEEDDDEDEPVAPKKRPQNKRAAPSKPVVTASATKSSRSSRRR